MIVHQWTGPGRYELFRARMLAEQGYVAFVADIYGLDAEGTPIRPPSGPAASEVATRFLAATAILIMASNRAGSRLKPELRTPKCQETGRS